MNKLEWLNGLSLEDAQAELLRCCGSHRWADAMARARPFKDVPSVYAEAGWLWSQTGPEDWKEAISHHPRIGDVEKLRERFKASGAWSEQEQKGMEGATEDVVQALADGNREYEARFGFTFLICATGKSAREMLEHLRERMTNPPALELRIAAGEQAQITRLRLEKLLTSP
ncbi:2-oxo-4-hydroxy-4-carboxy-5-ureidoimidazoline decarboxylase [Hyalangium minutum]|uniref:2-oxo-4-hydroxy-4-carboxy-5-ureidoimidazoline decarboxylase n=1 Tax=Hyalangium minutum TaxID=394096 RepID=A0A085W488_9BACT|nr:2-oxo-4-hydroxy-4-carboxy-5-ureidoimidazoline decarboxylase [Hyalangium minutum]KFE62501.1 2-oxo-4-hydroxy-4-carboxy--5-ureidoimidazoline (OHCU) decarboxylase [Hyalangium minutum]